MTTTSRELLQKLGVDMQQAEVQAESIIIDLYHANTTDTQLYVIATALLCAAEVGVTSQPGGHAAKVLLDRILDESREAARDEAV